MLGRATFTIVTSTSNIIIPKHTVSSYHHFRAIRYPQS